MFRNTYNVCQQIIIFQLEPKVLLYMVLQNHGRQTHSMGEYIIWLK